MKVNFENIAHYRICNTAYKCNGSFLGIERELRIQHQRRICKENGYILLSYYPTVYTQQKIISDTAIGKNHL